jgi:glucose-6-phosphate 1-dehydrogenase
MQVLTVLAMERPVSFAAEDIRDEKVRLHVERHFVVIAFRV